mmetsp:Transcript_18770/g.45187  ORF Transcript_18770/g.45187 Transcript_18770/m.45187 type:complete len:99 (-) Transcript_18770:623-919(-)
MRTDRFSFPLKSCIHSCQLMSCLRTRRCRAVLLSPSSANGSRSISSFDQQQQQHEGASLRDAEDCPTRDELLTGGLLAPYRHRPQAAHFPCATHLPHG